MIESFTDTGVMDGILLMNLLQTESDLPPAMSVEVLKAFHLVHLCGPPNSTNSHKYIFPFFSRRKVEAPGVYISMLPLKVDIFLRGLPVPSYVYSLITSAYLDINSDPLIGPEIGENGAIVTKDNGLIKHLLHDRSKSCVTLITLTPPEGICEAWKDLIDSVRKLILELKCVWKGIRFENVFYCSHCLLTNKPSPTKTVNPDWFKLEDEDEDKKNDKDARSIYDGQQTSICRKEGDKEHRFIPRPLQAPCKSFLLARVVKQICYCSPPYKCDVLLITMRNIQY